MKMKKILLIGLMMVAGAAGNAEVLPLPAPKWEPVATNAAGVTIYEEQRQSPFIIGARVWSTNPPEIYVSQGRYWDGNPWVIAGTNGDGSARYEPHWTDRARAELFLAKATEGHAPEGEARPGDKEKVGQGIGVSGGTPATTRETRVLPTNNALPVLPWMTNAPRAGTPGPVWEIVFEWRTNGLLLREEMTRTNGQPHQVTVEASNFVFRLPVQVVHAWDPRATQWMTFRDEMWQHARNVTNYAVTNTATR